MSKIGESIINLDPGVTVKIDGSLVSVSGPKGNTSVLLPDGIAIEQNDSSLLLKRPNDTKKMKSLHGLSRSLVANATTGVVSEWNKTLKVVGTGYRVKQQGTGLVFDLGYSHQVIFPEKEGVMYKVEGNDTVVVSGVDKQKVGEVAYMIKKLKKPDAYKGKGIRYDGEIIKLKPGKKVSTA